MKHIPLPPAEFLRECLAYDPATGELRWRERPVGHFASAGHWSANERCKNWNARWAGTPAFAIRRELYWVGTINSVRYVAHRIIWKLVYGTDPVGIDHIDGDGHNNRLDNLREATQAENCKNAARRADNTSGATGVYWQKHRRHWFAVINLHGRSRYLGSFTSKADAIRARKEAERECGYHENHGRVVTVEAA